MIAELEVEKKVLTYKSTNSLKLESGLELKKWQLQYCVFGNLTNNSKIVWVFHALTGSADVKTWWPQFLDYPNFINWESECVISANLLGSCYGSTGPQNAEKQYQNTNFPTITISDQVKALDRLRNELKIVSIDFAIGASLGGQVLLEWAAWKPQLFKKAALIASNAVQSAFAKGFNAVQKWAIALDKNYAKSSNEEGKQGLSLARSIAMLSYRSYCDFAVKQTATNSIESYLKYQGEKLTKRFDSNSYLSLLNTMDSHQVGRLAGKEIVQALNQIQTHFAIVSFTSDLLFPAEEQSFLHKHLPNSRLFSIETPHGHDSFLIESSLVFSLLQPFKNSKL